MVRLIRSSAISIGIFLALPWAALGQADEIFPVVHNDTITVRVLNGKYGVPITHAHLTLAGGYDARDIGLGLWQEELLTDKKGEVRLPSGLANLPFLQILVTGHKLCQAHPKADMFSVERMRRDGLSSPNRCGTFAVEDAPGVFTVFVKGDNGTSPVIHGDGTSPLITAANRVVVSPPAPVERQALAFPTLPVSKSALDRPSVEAGASTVSSKLISKSVSEAGSGAADSASPGSTSPSSTVSSSAVSGSAVSGSPVLGSATPGSAYQTDPSQPPFAGMDKLYFTTPSAARTLLLAPIPVAASPRHPAPRAVKAPFPDSPTSSSLKDKEAETPDSAEDSEVAPSKRHTKTSNKDLSGIPSRIPSKDRSSARKAAAAPDSDPEGGSPRRHPRKARTNPSAVSSEISPSIRKLAPVPGSAPAGTSPPQSSAKANKSPFTSPAPAEKAGAAPVPAPGKDPTVVSGNQAQPASSKPGAIPTRNLRSASAKPRAGALADSDSDSAASQRTPKAPAAKSEQTSISACQAVPEK